MSAPAQIAANRRNAQKSSGPKTGDGKAAPRVTRCATASRRGRSSVTRSANRITPPSMRPCANQLDATPVDDAARWARTRQNARDSAGPTAWRGV